MIAMSLKVFGLGFFFIFPLKAETVSFLNSEGKSACTFQVEVARTEAEREKGLMYRTSLPQNAGMLFVFEHPQIVSFWMKNTPLVLDIIYMDAQKRVTQIYSKAVPYALTPLVSNHRTQYVLEIKGGRATECNIKVGNSMVDG